MPRVKFDHFRPSAGYSANMTNSSATVSSYDPFAVWYQDWLGNVSNEASGDPYFSPLLDLVGGVSGQKVLDLACGQGRVARTLAGLGANVVGVDVSVELLTIAARYQKSDQIEYRHDNAHTLGSCHDAEFDGVVCNMSLMDIPDLTATFTSAFRVLRPGGWFAFSTFHPCFNSPLSDEFVDDDGRYHRTVTGYFTEGYWKSDKRPGPPGKIGAYHRTLTTLLNTVIDTGFTLRRVREIAGPVARWEEVPPVLAAIIEKPHD